MTIERIRPETFMSDVAKPAVQSVIRAKAQRITYSERYSDDMWEYRHVILPQELAKILPKTYLMPEREWRAIGVQQSLGWEHYMIHRPEPHVLLFRRHLGAPLPTPTLPATVTMSAVTVAGRGNGGAVPQPGVILASAVAAREQA
jgi:cyclin-dependent kinase regulatory subunit CKS1